MKTKTVLLLLVILLAALIFTQGVGAMDSDHFILNWRTPLNTAGGGSTASTHYQTNLTIGQTVIQASSSTSYRVRMGIWAGMLQRWFQHLPLIVNVSP